ncbi:TPA: hypothetical protein EYG96_02235 [Candidatus Gracilibacteria bacterium]|nr:hypothetical protein [Candidatus Peregrinibacteria bacterium]HIQ56840.1 hypothetical protein [Candidatus Gracilibacteria bacterium]HIQ57057.1 hypothetical protein [Candidatus Gracilibacteria bacterium]
MKFFSPALILSFGTLLSYLLGIVRDIFFARHYGATVITDTYFSAFLISDIIMIIFVSSALLGLVTPLFLQERENDKQSGYTLFGIFFASLLSIFTVISFLGIIFTPEILSIFFSAQLEKEPTLFINLARLFFITNFFFAISNCIGNFLMAHKHFLSAALSPLIYNIGILIGILFFANDYGIYAAAYGAVAGSIGHLLLRLWEYFSEISIDKRFYPSFNWQCPQLKELGSSMAFRWLTVGTLQITLVSIQNFSQTFKNEEGLYSLFLYARNIESAPVMIFGFAIATASFQVLSQLFAENKKEQMSKIFFVALYKILFWTIPMAVGIYFLGSYFLANIYSIEIASPEYAILHSILIVISLAIPLESVLTLFVRAFNATGDTKTPMIITFSQVGALVLTMLCFRYFGADLLSPALQIGTSYLLSFIASISVGYFLLHHKNIIEYSSEIFVQKTGFFLSIIGSFIMGLFLFFILQYIHLNSLLLILFIAIISSFLFFLTLFLVWKKNILSNVKKML